MAYEYLETTEEDGITICTLFNPPENTIVAPQVTEMHEMFDKLEADGTSRILILTGRDPEVFLKHYEVAELTGLSKMWQENPNTDIPHTKLEFHDINRLVRRMESSPVITIAAINGNAGGGGCEISLGCDFRLQKEGDYRFGLFEVLIGIIPGAGGTQRFVRLLGAAKAMDLILHGQMLTPQEALDLNLVHRVFPAETYWDDVMAFARNLLKNSEVAMAVAKRMIRHGPDMPMDEALKFEQSGFNETMHSPDTTQSMQNYVDGKLGRMQTRYPAEPV